MGTNSEGTHGTGSQCRGTSPARRVESPIALRDIHSSKPVRNPKRHHTLDTLICDRLWRNQGGMEHVRRCPRYQSTTHDLRPAGQGVRPCILVWSHRIRRKAMASRALGARLFQTPMANQ